MAAARYQLHLDLHTNYPEFVITVGKILFGEKERAPTIPQEAQTKIREKIRKEYPEKSKKEVEDEIAKCRDRRKVLLESEKLLLTQAVCALLNSGGGVIKVEIETEAEIKIESKGYAYDQDGIGLDIVKSFRECIQFKEFSEYFDFQQEGSFMLIFVKTWSGENPLYTRLCSLDTGLYERSDSCAVKRNPMNAADFLRKKKADFKRGSREEGGPASKKSRFPNNVQASRQAGVDGDEDVQGAAMHFLQRDRLEFEEILSFTESTDTEFKQLYKDKDILEFVRGKLPIYVCAFANAKGGCLIFGVDDNRKVIGHEHDIEPEDLERVVSETIDGLPHVHFCASTAKVAFECKVLPVYDRDEIGHGYVFVVRVQPFCCIVFTQMPDSWTVESGNIKRLTATEWIHLMLAEDPSFDDLSKLAERFTKVLSLSDGPPMIKPVYSNGGLNTMDELRKTLFPANSDRVAFIPQALCSQLFSKHPRLKDLVENEIPLSAQGTVMFSRSWAVDLGLPKNQAIECDAVLIASGSYVYLFTVVENLSLDIYAHSRCTARALKSKLVNVGGYSQKVCVIPRILCLQGDVSEDQSLLVPRTYILKKEHLPRLQDAIIIVLLNFTSFLSDSLGVQFLNLLTIEQYKKLSKNLEKVPFQFIYGMPGSGKTVVALKIIEKIKNEYNCQPDEILYICENRALRDFVGRKIPSAVTRFTFMKEDFPNVKHIIIDEAQNFRKEDGDWYTKARSIVCRNHPSSGIFWVFMDYWQMSHPFCTGLPPPGCQYPQDHLTVGVRNAVEIYKIMDEEMKAIVENRQLNIPHKQLRRLLQEAKCGHSVAGVCKTLRGLERKEIARWVAKQCQNYLEKGYSGKDIAILCSTKEASADYCDLLKQEMRRLRLDSHLVPATEVLTDKIVLDSVRRFSGLERPIVFGVNPVPSQEMLLHNLLLCVASRANQHLHLLYEI